MTTSVARVVLGSFLSLGLAFSGCFGGPPPASNVDPLVPLVPEPVTRVDRWEGEISNQWVLCLTPNHCQYEIETGGRTLHEFKANGTIRSLNLSFSWTPSTPFTEKLEVVVYKAKEDAKSPEKAGTWERFHSEVGSSPLRVNLEKLNVTSPDAVMGVVKVPPTSLPAQSSFWFARTQPFHMTGKITFVPNNQTTAAAEA